MFFMNRKMKFPIPEEPFRNFSKNLDEECQISQKCIPESVPQAISVVGEVYRIDKCYLHCQRYVHNYIDPYCKLLSPHFLLQQEGECGIKLDRSPALMTQSVAGNVNRQPVSDISFSIIPANSKSSDTTCWQWICIPIYVVDLIVIGIYAALNIICT